MNEGKSFVVGSVGINEDFADIVAQVVADCANNNVAFLQQECRCFTLLCGAGNRFPKMDQVIQVRLKFFARATDAGRAHNNAHFVRHVDAFHGFTQLSAFITFNAA